MCLCLLSTTIRVLTNILVDLASYTTIKIILYYNTIQQTNYGSPMKPLNIAGEDVVQNEVSLLTLSMDVQQGFFTIIRVDDTYAYYSYLTMWN